jgi:hypothetical protein
MVHEESWSSFHHKYASEGYRRSSEFDRGDDGNRRVSGAVRTLLKRCSSRKFIVPDECIRQTMKTTSSSQASLKEKSRTSMSVRSISIQNLKRNRTVAPTA